jgi:hypothetical protein
MASPGHTREPLFCFAGSARHTDTDKDFGERPLNLVVAASRLQEAIVATLARDVVPDVPPQSVGCPLFAAEARGIQVETGQFPDPPSGLQADRDWTLRRAEPGPKCAGAVLVTDVGYRCHDSGYYRSFAPLSFGYVVNWEGPANVEPPDRIVPAGFASLVRSGLIYESFDPFPGGTVLPRAVVISPQARRVESPEDVAELVRLVQHRARLPVVVVTRTEDGAVPGASYLVDPDVLAADLLGYAHVVAMEAGATRLWTNAMGRDVAVFWGAVGLYGGPRHPFGASQGLDFRRWLAEHVLAAYDADGRGPEAFRRRLVREVRKAASHDRLVFAPVDFLRFAKWTRSVGRAIEAQVARVATPTPATVAAPPGGDPMVEALGRAEREREEFKGQAEEWKQLLSVSEEENRELRRQIEALLELRNPRTDEREGRDGAVQTAEGSIPASFDGLREWAERWLSGRLVVVPRALRTAAKSNCKLVRECYLALLALATEYRDMRLGKPKAGRAWDERLAGLGMKDEGAIGESTAGEQGDAYEVEWPKGSGRKRQLDRHLKRGSGRTHGNSARIYYFWDRDRSVVVVGDMPDHLDNSLT